MVGLNVFPCFSCWETAPNHQIGASRCSLLNGYWPYRQIANFHEFSAWAGAGWGELDWVAVGSQVSESTWIFGSNSIDRFWGNLWQENGRCQEQGYSLQQTPRISFMQWLSGSSRSKSILQPRSYHTRTSPATWWCPMSQEAVKVVEGASRGSAYHLAKSGTRSVPISSHPKMQWKKCRWLCDEYKHRGNHPIFQNWMGEFAGHHQIWLQSSEPWFQVKTFTSKYNVYHDPSGRPRHACVVLFSPKHSTST